ncbi:MAG: T9SS type A sorting domain-containing protein [Bacteroidota bacterium]
MQNGWLAPQQRVAWANYHKTQPSVALIDSLNTSRTSQVDFQVQTISHRHLRISFNNRSGRSIFVKIYDVIGNLIQHEKIDRKGKFKKEYDLSDASSDFYVIEVGDEQYSTVKRLFPN